MVSSPAEQIPDLSFHLASRTETPEAAGSLTLVVGGVSVRMSGLTDQRKTTLQRRYGIFCRATVARPDIEIRLRQADRPGFLTIRQPDELYRVDTRWQGDTMLACSYEWAGWLDSAEGRGGLTLADPALTDPRAFDRSLENFLRVVFAHLIIGRGGFLLHSAGLVRDGRAFLFFGPSGSGKTTVTTLTPEALILSDDLTMVVRSAEGEYRACSVPFRGLFAPEPVSDRSWPVAGFFRLVQDDSDRLVEVGGARAVGELIGSLPFVTERPEMAGEVMDVVAATTIKVPVFRLHFRKDRTFWKIVDGRCPPVDGFFTDGSIKA